ncbi:MAG: hypothetical protein II358_00795, partial [Tidjanibacter sp.]|nr:hypothetical protein [Tidjanibacter sp.]
MKKRFFGSMKIMSLLLVAAAGLITSCENNHEEDPLGRKELIISATIEDFNAARATDTAFEEGDQIGLH